MKSVFVQSQKKLTDDVNDYLFRKPKRDKFAKEISKIISEIKR